MSNGGNPYGSMIYFRSEGLLSARSKWKGHPFAFMGTKVSIKKRMAENLSQKVAGGRSTAKYK